LGCFQFKLISCGLKKPKRNGSDQERLKCLVDFFPEGNMPSVKHVSAKKGDVILMVGTMKGAFVLRSNGARKKWDVVRPYSIRSPVYAMAFDQRQGRRRLWWAQQSFRWGTVLCSSDNYGKTITEPETYSVKFPVESKLTLKNIWQIRLGRAEEPDTLYCGVEPAAL